MAKAEFTVSDLEALRERGENLKKPDRTLSFRQVVFKLYPTIQKAIDSGMTRQEVYEQLLTDEMRQKIAPVTFLNYYHAAKREARKAEMSGAKERGKGKRDTGQATGEATNRAEKGETGGACDATGSHAQESGEGH